MYKEQLRERTFKQMDPEPDPEPESDRFPRANTISAIKIKV